MSLRDIIFFDKDSTLGEFGLGRCGLYTGVKDFLQVQHDKNRELYVATSANEGGRIHIKNIEGLINGYFGKDRIGIGSELYILPDGTFRKVNEDFTPRISFLSKEQETIVMDSIKHISDRLFKLNDGFEKELLQEGINNFFEYWHGLIHKTTKEQFDESTRYQNPNVENGWHTKDLYLAKRLISPANYSKLRSVMVGDHSDETTVASDPETPLIIISYKVRKGNWNYVSSMIDRLFSDPKEKPCKVYDDLFASSKVNGDERVYSLEGLNFKLNIGKRGNTRWIYCD